MGNDKIEMQQQSNEIALVTVVCGNPACRYDGQRRTVGLLHLGQGVYQQPLLMCECGKALTFAVKT